MSFSYARRNVSSVPAPVSAETKTPEVNKIPFSGMNIWFIPIGNFWTKIVAPPFPLVKVKDPAAVANMFTV
tara:strand:+ start:158 stop:370 length:213 start_codon:yes stop_codon:yes gene_type:complete